VTLNKDKGESLGLSLSFGSEDEEEECEVFVGGLMEKGVAAKDGRVREGDQVLQVDGISLTSRPQAEHIMVHTDLAESVTLLLSRMTEQVCGRFF
jgi:C-terminal processing protease CtpA/Prc